MTLPTNRTTGNTPAEHVNDHNVLHALHNTLQGSTTPSVVTAAEVAAKADDSAVVKLTGNQTKTGVLTFSDSPVVPTPTTAGQAATKGYVDSISGAASGGVFYVGDATGVSATDKANALTAIAAATAATRGGIVKFGPGDYALADAELVLPAFSTGKQVSLVGSGRESTRLNFTTDRGAGTYSIRGSAARETDNYFCSISDMRIIGPQARPATIGTWPANSMTGIRWGRGMTLEHLDIVGFYAAVESDSNHCDMRTCTISDNYYGVYFTTSGYGGDVTLYDCDLGGNLMASIAVSGTHANPAMSDGLATFCMIKGHLGFSPYGIYIESGAGAGLSLGGVLLVGTSWEFLGNGAIFSVGQTGRIDGLVMIGNGVFSNSNASYKIAATPYGAHIKVASLVNATWTDTNVTGTTGVADAWLDVSATLQNLRWEGFEASYDASVTAGVPFILGPATQSLKNIVLDSGESLTAFAAPCSQFFAIAAGEIVERRDIATVQPYGSQGATSKGQIAGISLNGMASSSRQYAIVATKGHDLTIASDGAIGITDVLVPSTANPSKVVGLQSDGTTATLTKPVLGRPYIATGGAGTVRANLDIR